MPLPSRNDCRSSWSALYCGLMEDLSRHKAELRQKQRGLQRLLNEWDPIGVMSGGETPSDEYDCLFGVLGQLHNGASRDQLTEYLREQLLHHFGLNPNESRPEQFASDLFVWYWANPLPGSIPQPGG
jgi:hypothetical protein